MQTCDHDITGSLNLRRYADDILVFGAVDRVLCLDKWIPQEIQ